MKNKFFSNDRSILAVYGNTDKDGTSAFFAVTSSSYLSRSFKNDATFTGSTLLRIGAEIGANKETCELEDPNVSSVFT